MEMPLFSLDFKTRELCIVETENKFVEKTCLIEDRQHQPEPSGYFRMGLRVSGLVSSPRAAVASSLGAAIEASSSTISCALAKYSASRPSCPPSLSHCSRPRLRTTP